MDDQKSPFIGEKISVSAVAGKRLKNVYKMYFNSHKVGSFIFPQATHPT